MAVQRSALRERLVARESGPNQAGYYQWKLGAAEQSVPSLSWLFGRTDYRRTVGDRDILVHGFGQLQRAPGVGESPGRARITDWHVVHVV